MSDVVVTVPKAIWDDWCEEGDLPGAPWTGLESHFYLFGYSRPTIEPGERVYVVARNALRGYAPLVRIDTWGPRYALVRHGGAVAVTITQPIRGFRGWRYRWWKQEQEYSYEFGQGQP